jgi:hypothetical protein
MASDGNGTSNSESRIIDVPIESLPFIDEHFIEIAAKPDEVWDALIRAVSVMGESRKGAPISKALGCEETQAEGATGEIGSKIPGFVVTRSIRPAVLALMGQHRFSQYALIFTILEKPSGLMLLSAQTRAVFPGRKGRLYRGLVIGTHGHVIVTTSLLRQVRRRAERIHARPARA